MNTFIQDNILQADKI